MGQFYESGWRRFAAPIIARVIAEHVNDPNGLKRALLEAYPFGQRKYHPYRIWCDEIQRQLGKKPPLRSFGQKTKEKMVVGYFESGDKKSGHGRAQRLSC